MLATGTGMWRLRERLHEHLRPSAELVGLLPTCARPPPALDIQSLHHEFLGSDPASHGHSRAAWSASAEDRSRGCGNLELASTSDHIAFVAWLGACT